MSALPTLEECSQYQSDSLKNFINDLHKNVVPMMVEETTEYLKKNGNNRKKINITVLPKAKLLLYEEYMGQYGMGKIYRSWFLDIFNNQIKDSEWRAIKVKEELLGEYPHQRCFYITVVHTTYKEKICRII